MTVWILVVIYMLGDVPVVWPGATSWLIGKPDAVYATQSACASDRRRLWSASRKKPELSVRTARCLSVQIPREAVTK